MVDICHFLPISTSPAPTAAEGEVPETAIAGLAAGTPKLHIPS